MKREDTARKQASPDELNSFLHEYQKKVGASRPIGQVSSQAVGRVNKREAAMPQKSSRCYQSGHLGQGLVHPGGVLAAAAGLCRFPTALAADDGSNDLDNLPGLDAICQ